MEYEYANAHTFYHMFAINPKPSRPLLIPVVASANGRHFGWKLETPRSLIGYLQSIKSPATKAPVMQN